MALELVPTNANNQLTYSFDSGQLEDLAKPLNQSLIKERPGPGGKQLKYITGKTAIDTANKIFGMGKWGYRVLSKSREVVGDKEYYTADVELYVLGCPFPFPGEGEGIPLNNTPEQHAKARKEAVTDALKRALRHFGDQFGLCLYDENALVEDDQGNLTQVKNVHPQQSKKTVDATPLVEVPTPAQLKARCAKLFGDGKWETVKARLLNQSIADDDMKPADCRKIDLDFKAREEAKKAS